MTRPQHLSSCAVFDRPPYPCNCGTADRLAVGGVVRSQVLKRIAEGLGETTLAAAVATPVDLRMTDDDVVMTIRGADGGHLIFEYDGGDQVLVSVYPKGTSDGPSVKLDTATLDAVKVLMGAFTARGGV